MSMRVLVLGGTGTLGHTVVRSLVGTGHTARVLARSPEKARGLFGPDVEVAEGDSTDRDAVRAALDGCHATHISLPTESELIATRHVVEGAADSGLERISYVSGTSAREENRWFDVIDTKLRAEDLVAGSGIPFTIFHPTWVMEVLPNFVKPGRAVVIQGRNPPPFHFFAAADFGRMVSASYGDERALGKRLWVHGPEGITLPDALLRFFAGCHPELPATRLRLWQAWLVARLTRNTPMQGVVRLIRYFDTTEEHGDPTEANDLLGAPATTLADWIETRRRGP